MECCCAKGIRAVVRRRRYPTLTYSLWQQLAKADSDWSAKVADFVRRWRRACAGCKTTRLKATERIGRVAAKAVARSAFRRLKRTHKGGRWVAPIVCVVGKWVKLAIGKRVERWKQFTREHSSREHKFLCVGEQLQPLLRRKYRATLLLQLSTWRSQAQKAISVQSQARRLAIAQFRSAVRAAMWRVVKWRFRQTKRSTDGFRAVAKIVASMQHAKERFAVSCWRAEATTRSGTLRVHKQLHTISITRFIRRAHKSLQREALHTWVRWDDWRGLGTCEARLQGAQYSVLSVLPNLPAVKTEEIAVYRPLEVDRVVSVVLHRYERVDTRKQQVDDMSNYVDMRKVRIALQRQAGKIEAKAKSAFFVWKNRDEFAAVCRIHYLQRLHYFAFQMKLLEKARVKRCFVALRRNDAKGTLRRAVRAWRKGTKFTLKQCVFTWRLYSSINSASRLAGLSQLVRTLQRLSLRTALALTLRAVSRPRSVRKSVATVSRTFARSLSTWLTRWTRHSQQCHRGKLTAEIRSVRMQVLLRRRTHRNAVYHLRLFRQRLLFRTLISAFLKKWLRKKEKGLVALGLRTMGKRVTEGKVIPPVMDRMLRAMEERLCDCLEVWRTLAEEERRKTPRGTYFSTFKSLFRR